MTHTEKDDLVGRLKETTVFTYDEFTEKGAKMHNALLEEAAARITALERELAEAREALKPFKDRLFDRTTFEEALYGKKYWAADSVEIYVPIGDLRRAARTYAGE